MLNAIWLRKLNGAFVIELHCSFRQGMAKPDIKYLYTALFIEEWPDLTLIISILLNAIWLVKLNSAYIIDCTALFV